MANPEHLRLLTHSVADWNKWRRHNSDIRPDLNGANLNKADLSGADLTRAYLHEAKLIEAALSRTYFTDAQLFGANLKRANLNSANLNGAILNRANLSGASLREATLKVAYLYDVDLSDADLCGANLTGANLTVANLTEANLTEADLKQANLNSANLTGAILNGAKLREANLTEANLTGADLAGATLERSILVNTTCNKAIFTGCRIHGISAWDLQLEEAQQTNLIITPSGEPDITVDKLEVAQFIYLLLNNPRIREVIDTITAKVVLILGRFTLERKVVLNAIRERLRIRNYSPVVFDFEKPMTRDLTETVMTLAGMAKFVIADLTDPKSIPHELMSFVEKLPSVAVQPLLLASQKHEYAMFEHLQRYPWVMKTVLYQDQETLLRSLESTVILPAERKAKKLLSTQRK